MPCPPPASPATTPPPHPGSPPPGRSRPTSPQPPAPPPPRRAASALTPGGLARLQDTLLRYAVSLLSGPTGLAAYLRTQLTGGFFPAPSLPLDLGQPTEQVPPHLRRAVTKRDRHCSFPGCHRPARPLPGTPRDPPVPGRADPPGQPHAPCAPFHRLIAVHRWGWTLQLHGDGTTTATSPDRTKTLHSHSPPPGQDTLMGDRPTHGPPATAA